MHLHSRLIVSISLPFKTRFHFYRMSFKTRFHFCRMPFKTKFHFCRMPNENAPVCGCGVVVDLPKSRNGALSSRRLTIRIPKSKGGKSDGRAGKKQQDDARGKSRSSETGSCSSVTEQARPVTKSSKHEKRLNHSRRTRSADRAESHYTYIGKNLNCSHSILTFIRSMIQSFENIFHTLLRQCFLRGKIVILNKTRDFLYADNKLSFH